MTTPPEDLLPTRETLLLRLRDLDDDKSWREFFDTYWKLIFSVARKAGFNEAAAQDIVQETFVAISRHMPEFRYNPELGSFKGWMLQITRSRIIDASRGAGSVLIGSLRRPTVARRTRVRGRRPLDRAPALPST